MELYHYVRARPRTAIKRVVLKRGRGVSSLRVCNASVCVRKGSRFGVVNEGGLAVAERAISGDVRIGCGSADRSLFLVPHYRRA